MRYVLPFFFMAVSPVLPAQTAGQTLHTGLAQGQQQFVNKVYVTNGSSSTVVVTVEPKQASTAHQGGHYVVAPGEKVLIGSYHVGRAFASPVQHMKVTGTTTTSRGKQRSVGVLMMEDHLIDAEHKAWIYHVLPTGGRVGFGF